MSALRKIPGLVAVAVFVCAQSSLFPCEAVAQSNVQITGGTIDNTVIGGKTPAAATFSSLGVTNQSATGTIASVTATVPAPASGASSSGALGLGVEVDTSGNGQSYGFNPLIKWLSGAAPNGQIIEVDGDNFASTQPCEPAAPVNGCTSENGILITGSSGHYSSSGTFQNANPMSRAIFITGADTSGNNRQWYDGIDFVGDDVLDYDLLITNKAQVSLYDRGSHSYGVELAGNYSTAALAIVQPTSGANNLTIDGQGNLATIGTIATSSNVMGSTVTSSGPLTTGSSSLGAQIVNVSGSGSGNSSFPLSPNGQAVAQGNTIGNFYVTGAIIAIINCEDHANSLTWQLSANYVNATTLTYSAKVLSAAGASSADWSVAAGYASGSPTITVTTTDSATLYCTGPVTVIRQS